MGAGFHMGKDMRLSFNTDQSNPDTQVREHRYEKLLISTALTSGF